jgi:hypothetical protein
LRSRASSVRPRVRSALAFPDNGTNGRPPGHHERRRGAPGGGQRRPRPHRRDPRSDHPAGHQHRPVRAFILETTTDEITTRALDLIAPIGRGQRCLVVAPPMAGKTTLLIKIANALTVNYPEILLYVLLVDERPEEVTHFRRSTKAEVHAASSDMSAADHIRVAEACVNQALEHVVQGKDVVMLLDSITRLARAYNAFSDSGGRTCPAAWIGRCSCRARFGSAQARAAAASHRRPRS